MTKRAKYLALIGVLVVSMAAFRFGGWAVITVQDVAEYGVAGAPMEITYDVRQHGIGLTDAMGGTVIATSGELSTTAKPTSLGRGRYRAMVNLSAPGQWTVNVKTGWGPSGNVEMLPITVVAKSAPAPAPLSAMKRGHQLFVAKGCVTCHSHQLTRGYATTNTGPDLSEPKFMAAYLTRFLADPSVKTNWANASRMPTLGLKPAEITALVAFLNRETKAASR